MKNLDLDVLNLQKLSNSEVLLMNGGNPEADPMVGLEAADFWATTGDNAVVNAVVGFFESLFA